jgi:hypothetical protein
MSKPEEQEVILTYLHPYLNIDKHFPLLPDAKNMALQAGLMGLEEEKLFSARVVLAERINIIVNELSKDEKLVNFLKELPFKDGDKMVAIGDSNTDDLGSWFYILKHFIEEHRKDIKLSWVNHAVSYHTSTDTLRQASRTVLAEEGDWYFCATGLFDSAKLDVMPDRPMVALAESWENLAALEDAIDKVCENPIIWINPAPVNAKMQEDFNFFDFTVENEDIQAFREVMSGRKGYLVETFNTLDKNEIGDWYYKADGIHLSEIGQTILVKEIIMSIALQKNG